MPESNRSRQKRLARILRKLRLDARASQADLARRLRRHQSFVSKYESGERRLDLFELKDICRALGSSLESLVKNLEGDGP